VVDRERGLCIIKGFRMIQDAVVTIKKRIAAACARVNRDSGLVSIVAVSKNHTAQEIEEAIRAGITDIGESRVREALQKHGALQAAAGKKQASWHMIGHLQTNKVKEAVKIFDLIHSLDSLRLAEEIDKQAAQLNKIQEVLLEIKTSEEATKSGIAPAEAPEIAREMARFKNIRIKGLMTIAPLADDPEKARPYFRRMRELRDKINGPARSSLTVLSMGMSDDFEVAIEEGATMVRLGRAIFEG
jgi:PLP dependent protein